MEYMFLRILTTDTNAANVSIPGESTLSGHATDIELLSYSHGISNPVQSGVSNTGRTTGRPNFNEMVISKRLDATSPLLNFYCAQAKDLGKVTLMLVRQDPGGATAGQNVIYMTYIMWKTLVSSVSVGGSGDIPIETVTLNYTRLDWSYITQDKAMAPTGTIAKYWDQETNTGTT